MNKNDLFNVIGEISDDLVLEANNPIAKMRRVRTSKVIALAAAIVMLFGITVFAASAIRGGISGHSSSIPTYYSVPARETLQRDIGIQLNVIDVFSNGYRFKSGHIVYNKMHDADGNVTEQYKSLNCKYKSGGDIVVFNAEASIAVEWEDELETAETYDNSKIKYYKYINKIVPGNYELTEQDKKDKESGKYVFSYGAANGIELCEVQGLNWDYGGLSYSLCAIDNGITKDELIQMAKEIIDCQK